MSELAFIAERLEAAQCPEDIWPSENNLKATFRRIAQIIHPDHNDNSPLAQTATMRLNLLKNEADARIKAGTFGQKIPLPEHALMDINRYSVKRTPLRGDVADVYFSESAVLKVSRTSDDNDLLCAERAAIHTLGRIPSPVVNGVPKLLETFSVGEANGWKREANVFDRANGYYTAEQVHAKVPSVDGRTLVWMFKRLLVLLEWTHKLGLVHGAVLPPHVMFYPDNDEGLDTALPDLPRTSSTYSRTNDPRKHSVLLVDWCYSVEFAKRTRLSAWCPLWKTHYPSELTEKKSVGPSSDIFMAAALIMYLSDGKALTNGLEKPLKDVLVRCLQKDPAKRYQNAGQAYEAWKEAAARVYGAPKWHEFVVPR